MVQRKGQLIWQGKIINWEYATFKDKHTFELHPHFIIKATDPKTKAWVEWADVTIDLDELKGIQDFTKLPEPLRNGILDNCVIKLNEEPPALTRLTPRRDV